MATIVRAAKVTKNTTGNGYISGRVNIPADFLRALMLNVSEPNKDNNISMTLKGDKIIIEKITEEDAKVLKDNMK